LSVDQEVWAIFGKIGKPISDMDMLIAATAKRYSLVLATNDSDLDNLDYQSEIEIDREN
jgi:predicted nucleic acid-binding protein